VQGFLSHSILGHWMAIRGPESSDSLWGFERSNSEMHSMILLFLSSPIPRCDPTSCSRASSDSLGDIMG
jgi:hypothetical protein